LDHCCYWTYRSSLADGASLPNFRALLGGSMLGIIYRWFQIRRLRPHNRWDDLKINLRSICLLFQRYYYLVFFYLVKFWYCCSAMQELIFMDCNCAILL
jgi:hypothetical protein